MVWGLLSYFGGKWMLKYDGVLGCFEYDEQLWRVDQISGQEILRYVGNLQSPEQPIGCTNFSFSFEKCPLHELYLGHWDMVGVTSTKAMFLNSECYKIHGLESWQMSTVDNMSCMFAGCLNLTELNVGSWDTSQLQDCSGFVFDCINLKQLNVSSWNTKKLNNAANFACMCLNLESLDVAWKYTAALMNVQALVQSCSKLKHLQLFNISYVLYINPAIETRGMLSNCVNLDKSILRLDELSQVQLNKLWFDHHLDSLEVF